ncbi:FCD domain-containing protein, partial [Escherichia coli]
MDNVATKNTINLLIDRLCGIKLRFDHVSPPEMLLRQHLDIFSALQKRDGDAVERAMTQHLQEISESVRQIRQENSDWFSEE